MHERSVPQRLVQQPRGLDFRCRNRGDRCLVTGRVSIRQYETDTGEKRSSTEIVADELGLSTKWAVVTAERNERKGSGNQGDN